MDEDVTVAPSILLYLITPGYLVAVFSVKQHIFISVINSFVKGHQELNQFLRHLQNKISRSLHGVTFSIPWTPSLKFHIAEHVHLSKIEKIVLIDKCCKMFSKAGVALFQNCLFLWSLFFSKIVRCNNLCISSINIVSW